MLLSPEIPEEQSFDVGRVIAGEVLTHTFQLKNSSPETIAVKDERDIRLDCGCSSIVPGTRVLQPGDQTEITVTVRTGGLKRKQGRFANGGKIVWTAASGRRQATSLLLRGEALPPFASDPPALAFTPEEVKRGAAKELVLTANVTIDWSTWTVTSSSPYFQIVEPTQAAQGKNARIQVKCLPPEGIDEFRGELRVQAQARRSGAEDFPVSMTILVQARQAVELSITPRVASVIFGPSGEPAEVKLVLRGDKVAKGQIQIQAIRYEGCEVTWKVSQAPQAPSAVLEVTLVRKPLKPSGKETTPSAKDPVLLIQLAGGKSIPWPVVEVGPSLDAP